MEAMKKDPKYAGKTDEELLDLMVHERTQAALKI